MLRSGVFSSTRSPSVLFVDADDDTRFAYQALGVSEGLHVELAADGHEAITIANVVLPDVIVMDPRLSGIDGFEVVRRLRASGRTRAIPILIVSSDDDDAFAEAVRSSGCNGRLLKPCSVATLLDHVHSLGTRPRSARVKLRAR